MSRLRIAVAVLVLGGVGSGLRGDEPKKAETKPGPAPKEAHQLPAGWGSGCTARRASHLRPASRLR
jgi:hypothetical protein